MVNSVFGTGLEGVKSLIDTLAASREPAQLQALQEELETPGLVSRIRQAIRSECSLLESFEVLSSLDSAIANSPLALPVAPSDIYLGNLFFFSPQHFELNFAYYKQFLPRLGAYATTSSMCNSGMSEFILQKLTDPKLDFSVSPILGLHLAFATSDMSTDEQVALLRLVLPRIENIPGSIVCKTMIQKRINSLLQMKVATSAKVENPRAALLISGQMRDTENSLNRLASYFDLAKFDVFVSTWDKPGHTTLDRARLPRRLTPEAVEFARTQMSDEDFRHIQRVEASNLSRFSAHLEEMIKEKLGNAANLRVNLTDESEPPFSYQDNHWKMHFHNGYWLQKLGHQYFLDRYDLIVKIRPDMLAGGLSKAKPADFSNLGPAEIAVDYPTWLHEPWGFGMGDQFFYGPTPLMLSVLDIKFPDSLSTRMQMEILGRLNQVQGHISIGTELWLQGGNPTSMPFPRRGLASDGHLDIEALKLLLSTKEGK